MSINHCPQKRVDPTSPSHPAFSSDACGEFPPKLFLTHILLHRNFTLFHHPMYGNCYTFNNRENETILSTSMGGSEYGKEICRNSEHPDRRTVGCLSIPEMWDPSTWPETRTPLPLLLCCFNQLPCWLFLFLVSVFLFNVSSLLLREQQ